MKLITKKLATRLAAASLKSTQPVCKLFAPWGWEPEWLLTCEKEGLLYGYAYPSGSVHIKTGYCEWGCLGTLEDLEAFQGPFGSKIKRDLNWKKGSRWKFRWRSGLGFSPHWTPSEKAAL